MTVTSRLMGIETEYAITGFDSRRELQDRECLLHNFLDVARRKFAYVPDFQSGMFLGNGSRFYVDSGLHPELSTPECEDPRDAVAYVLAGERILAGLSEDLLARDETVSEIRLVKTNIDYWCPQSTWGCHESYLYAGDRPDISAQIVPHLVSRLIYSGCGGFNPFSPGIEYRVSPRVMHLERVVSRNSTNNRGIFHAKDEPLAKEGYHRLHVICGESLCSETAMWLKIGTTALVVAMIEAGIRPADGVELQSPLVSMRVFASDPSCSAQVPLANGQRVRAVDIQRHYLSKAEAVAGSSILPPWADEVCRQWRFYLDLLEHGPEAVSGALDWSTKYFLFQDQVARHGFDWDALPIWNSVLSKVKSSLVEAGHADKCHDARFILGPGSPVGDQLKHWTPVLQEHGFRWGDLAAFFTLRWKLFEADVRFGQLGAEGIFQVLDRDGVLKHRLESLPDLNQSEQHPPGSGRARVRGDFIRRHGGRSERYLCDWQGIWDCEEDRLMDLSDPFAQKAEWQPVPRDKRPWRRRGDGPSLMDILRARQRSCE